MIRRRMVVVAAVSGLAALATGACGSSDKASDGTSKSAGGAAAKITVVLPTLGDAAHLLEKAGIDAEAKKLGGKVAISVVAGSASTSSSELVAKIENAVTRGTDVIAVNAGDPKPVIPALRRAAQQGVKIVVFDVPIPELSEQTSFVGLDNRKGGELAGRWLKQHADGGAGELGILHCIPGLKITDDRVAGFKAGLDGAGFKLVSTLDAKCDRDKGRTEMENMISAHPNIKAVYSISDSQTFGAVKALDAVHKDPLVVSFDAQPEAQTDIKAGHVIDASVGQFPFKVGALATQVAARVALGKSVAHEVFSPLVMVDKTNVNKFKANERKLP